jgi:hypothetical protein
MDRVGFGVVFQILDLVFVFIDEIVFPLELESKLIDFFLCLLQFSFGLVSFMSFCICASFCSRHFLLDRSDLHFEFRDLSFESAVFISDFVKLIVIGFIRRLSPAFKRVLENLLLVAFDFLHYYASLFDFVRLCFDLFMGVYLGGLKVGFHSFELLAGFVSFVAMLSDC